MTRPLVLAVFAVAAVPTAGRSAPPVGRLAVVSAPAVRAGGLPDLLTAELSKLPGVELVERDDVRKAADERAVISALGAAGGADRRALGAALRADALVCLAAGPDPDTVRVVVCDCRTGLRVGAVTAPGRVEGAAAAALAAQVAELKDRYRGGVTTAVGLAPFGCDNLSHEWDHLRPEFTELVGSALAARPGVAVLEMDEARAVLAERALAGADPGRTPNPVMVEGDYTVTRPAGAAATVTFKVRVTTGGTTAAVEKAGVPLADAGAFLGGELPAAALRAVGGEPLSADRQFALLAARADRSARIGAFDTAVRVREAAVLLKPDAHDQRTKLLEEYRRRADHDQGAFDREFNEAGPQNPDGPTRARIARVAGDRAADYRHGLAHLEALVRAGRITLQEAVDAYKRLTDPVMYAVRLTPEADRPAYAAGVERVRRDALRHVFPLMLKLRPGKSPNPIDLFVPYATWEATLFFAAERRFDIRYGRVTDTNLSADDLRFVLELVRDVLPPGPTYPDKSAVGISLHRLVRLWSVRRGDGSGTDGSYAVRFTDAEYATFLAALEGSKRPLDVATGRLGRAWLGWKAGDKDADAVLKARFDEYAALLPADHTREQFRRQLPLRPYAAGPFVDPGHHFVSPPPPPRPAAFTPIEAKRRTRDGRVTPLAGTDWPTARPGFVEPILVRCGDKLDVYRHPGAVLFAREPGVFDEVLTDPAADFGPVTWDGANVWVGSVANGLWVLSSAGETLARVAGDPLPPADGGMVLHPLGPGRVLAAGSFGEHGRGWVATVERAGATATVKVIHEAKRVWAGKADATADPGDPAWAFVPLGFSPQPDGAVLLWRRPGPGGGDNASAVARSRFEEAVAARPLRVDPAAGTVGPYKTPAALLAEYRRIGPSGIIPHVFPDGTMFLNGRAFAPEGKSLPNGKASLILCDTPSERHVAWDGAMLSVGHDWFRIDPGTYRTTWLGYQPVSLTPTVGVSAHHGLIGVGWKGALYRVDPSRLPQNRTTAREGLAVPAAADVMGLSTLPDGRFKYRVGRTTVIGKGLGEFPPPLLVVQGDGDILGEIDTLDRGLRWLVPSPDIRRQIGLTAEQLAALKAAQKALPETNPFPAAKCEWAAGLLATAVAAADKAAAERTLSAALAAHEAEVDRVRAAFPAAVAAALTPPQFAAVRELGHGVVYLGGR